MARRNRKRRPPRQPPFKDPKAFILVVTEGEVTEPEYLRGFASACKNSRVKVQVIGGAGNPKTIVEAAKARKREAENEARRRNDDNLKYDEVWCVFDVDDHHHIQTAKQMARDVRIKVVVSNPCIELWLWLHFAEQPGMKNRHELKSMMKQHVRAYNKHVDFASYSSGYEAAANRAERLVEDAQLDRDEGRNPTTNMYELTRSIKRHA